MFIPDKPKKENLYVPYFEDVNASDVAGRRTKKSQKVLQSEIEMLIAKLGGSAVQFVSGGFQTSPTRYGFNIEFNVSGIPARIDAAALPIRTETDKKKDRALAQCLFLVRDWLQAEVNSLVYRPNSFALLPYLIGEGGKTVTESLMESRMLPDFGKYIALNGGKDK